MAVSIMRKRSEILRVLDTEEFREWMTILLAGDCPELWEIHLNKLFDDVASQLSSDDPSRLVTERNNLIYIFIATVSEYKSIIQNKNGPLNSGHTYRFWEHFIEKVVCAF
jgi:hypothetical protein